MKFLCGISKPVIVKQLYGLVMHRHYPKNRYVFFSLHISNSNEVVISLLIKANDWTASCSFDRKIHQLYAELYRVSSIARRYYSQEVPINGFAIGIWMRVKIVQWLHQPAEIMRVDRIFHMSKSRIYMIFWWICCCSSNDIIIIIQFN